MSVQAVKSCMKRVALLMLLINSITVSKISAQVPEALYWAQNLDTNFVATSSLDVSALKDGINSITILNKNEKIIGNILNGQMEGEWQYYKNGKLIRLINFSRGVFEGPYVEYFLNGNEKIVAYYQRSICVGTWVEFYENQKIRELRFYDPNGNFTSERKVYSQTGQLLIHQKWPTKDSLGYNSALCGDNWQSLSVHINDSLIFNGNEWYDNGKPKILCQGSFMHDDYIVNFTSFYLNGTKHISGAFIYFCDEYCCWQKIGKWSWFENDIVVKEEYYSIPEK